MQLAIRTNRLSALIIGGFPPIDGPYQEMLQVTMATYHMSVSPQSNLAKDTENTDKFDWSNVEVTMTEAQTKQFVTLYEQLKTFNDKEAQTKINCPRLCFAGSLDIISYGEKWGNVAVDIVSPLIHQRQALVEIGWDVYVLKGLDHSTAMQAKHVLPILRPWLDSQTLT
jgi:glutaredoxin-related protein